jgi:hypothetical protein
MGANAGKSKKPSGANSSSRPEPLVLFADSCLGRRKIPDANRRAGEEVRIHDELFASGTTDEEWLSEVGRRGWVVLTKDARIRYHTNEMQALRRAGVRAFVFTGRGDLTGEEIAKAFVEALQAMKRLLAKTTQPSIASVTLAAEVRLLFPKT